MSSTNDLLKSDDVKKYFTKIDPAFIRAFDCDPWYEVSRCVDSQQPQRCVNGLSSTALNSCCDICLSNPVEPAYSYEDVVQDFNEKSETSETIWYMERVMGEVALAGYAARKGTNVLASTVYRRVNNAGEWLNEIISDQEVAWLHELFADRGVRKAGNLRNFSSMCSGMMESLKTESLAFCTINPRMVAAAIRGFGEKATVYEANHESLDHRDFVIIKK